MGEQFERNKLQWKSLVHNINTTRRSKIDDDYDDDNDHNDIGNEDNYNHDNDDINIDDNVDNEDIA